MKGDFTRFTFRRADRYTGVRLQQGRVQVDADWNEQVDLQLDRERTEIRDVVGPLGAPVAEPGFGFVPLPPVGGGPQDFGLTPGRMYVDGILVEIGGEAVPGTGVATNRVNVDSPRLDGVTLAVGEWIEIRGGNDPHPVHHARISAVAPDGQATQLTFAPPVENPPDFADPTVRRLATYFTQPDLDSPPAPQGGTAYLAYLDVWERHVTAHENARLREVALGGPDTATRTQVAWQVRLEALEDEEAVCADIGPGWAPGGQSTGRLAARAQPAQDSATPCIVPQGAGYRRLENQLYRVEIHAGGGAGATYKWSRDNGHVVSRVKTVIPSTSEIEVEPQGRDDVLDFAPGQVVEITEAGAALRGETGMLAEVTEEADGVLTLTALAGDPPLDFTDVAAGWEVRRWEGTAEVVEGDWVDLEEGVQVRFAPGGFYRAGDWWAVPARTATGDVEWPLDGNAPAAVPPHGVAHAYCPLGIVTLGDDGEWDATDCRHLFPPLTGLVRMVYLGGDGQEAMPTTPDLAYPLQVGVLNGGVPVDNAFVRFSVVDGAGQIDGGAGFGFNPVLVPTVAGVASCGWRLGNAVHTQRVRAELIQYGSVADHPPIFFSANLSEAREVGFAAPSGCAGLAGSTTVQDALERLARTVNLFYVGGDGQHAVAGQALEAPLVVRVGSDCGPVAGASVTFTTQAAGGRLTAQAPTGPNQGGTTLTVPTETDGTARVFWRLSEAAGSNVVQQVTATISNLPTPWRAGGSTSITFTSKRLRADQVAYQAAAACAALAGTNNVQAALDALCAQLGGGGQQQPGIAVTAVRLVSLTSVANLNDSEIRIQDLTGGIFIDCAAQLDPVSFTGPSGQKPVCYLTLDVPEQATLTDPATGATRTALVGRRPVVLNAGVSHSGNRITWVPTKDALDYIDFTFGRTANLGVDRLLARLTLKG
ncbi:MAG TPA: DUF6519 domain-containing protein, partial [Longimicrobium sp.]|nr:DUF6519 domain-containing protein [Longimicrobium sp.]